MDSLGYYNEIFPEMYVKIKNDELFKNTEDKKTSNTISK